MVRRANFSSDFGPISRSTHTTGLASTETFRRLVRFKEVMIRKGCGCQMGAFDSDLWY